MTEEIEDKSHLLNVIDTQLYIISTLLESDSSLYDEFAEDKIKIITRALKVIYSAQHKILKEL